MQLQQYQDDEQLRHKPTGDLIKQAIDEVKLLARAEILHAKTELKEDLRAAKRAGIFLGAALALILNATAALFITIGLALPLSAPVGTLIVGSALLVGGLVLGFLGYKNIPMSPFEKTKQRLQTDLEVTREQLV